MILILWLSHYLESRPKLALEPTGISRTLDLAMFGFQLVYSRHAVHFSPYVSTTAVVSRCLGASLSPAFRNTQAYLLANELLGLACASYDLAAR